MMIGPEATTSESSSSRIASESSSHSREQAPRDAPDVERAAIAHRARQLRVDERAQSRAAEIRLRGGEDRADHANAQEQQNAGADERDETAARHALERLPDAEVERQLAQNALARLGRERRIARLSRAHDARTRT